MKSYIIKNLLLTSVAACAMFATSSYATVVITTEGQSTSWTVSNTDLLQTNLFSTDLPNPNGFTSPNTIVFDGTAPLPTPGHDWASTLTYGLDSSSGGNATVTFTLDTTVNTLGYDLTNANIYTNWDNGRASFDVTTYYKTVGSSTWVSLGSGSTQSMMWQYDGNAVKYADSTPGAVIASGVQSIKFDFSNQQNGWIGLGEIDVLGTATVVPEPSTWALLGIGLTALATLRRRRRMV